MKLLKNVPENVLSEDVLEKLFPVMKFHPVLTVSLDVVIPLDIVNAFSLQVDDTILSATKGVRHFICNKAGLCHKKQSIHLFLPSLAIFHRNSAASTLWLRQDSSDAIDVKLVPGALTLMEGIQLFLAQSGFDVEVKDGPVSLSDRQFLKSLLSKPKSVRVA